MVAIATLAPVLVSGCAPEPGAKASQSSFETLLPSSPELSAEQIMRSAHQAAGAETWRRPKTLVMDGYAIFYKGGEAVRHDRHRMWRVYDSSKQDAHKVDGKVRIRSERGGAAIIDLSYDGEVTYTPAGAQPKSESDARWSSNFGFGVIRHALDEGYTLARLPDDLIDGKATFMIEVNDAAGGVTHFGISQNDYAILKVGFDTPRGWHERIYSNFYSNPGESWVQPGRVRLYYNGVKNNEVIWETYTLNQALPDCIFVLPEVPGCTD